jgi:hypothetical protein
LCFYFIFIYNLIYIFKKKKKKKKKKEEEERKKERKRWDSGKKKVQFLAWI